ncbi:zinc finger protein 385D-like isoform X2 [Cyprinodon tularosa]|uniref:zinc finger protein 385D-like isoform X2 n=1 Tax=Cyprinodon variegatus TaxID=28743 RepID=UPI000742C06A|nr:PREDICTED: zinc finger protein 385D-like isoform X2 [Cyprinodon variegatus]XP_038144584.1 zinc finger protein 385D-like isoform X2 [Cyprinodon tularosa]
MYFGNIYHGPLPPLAHHTLGRTQPSPDPKALFPLHLLPGFANMDQPSFGLTSPLKRKPSSCGVCRVRFTPEAEASFNYSGTRHEKNLKAVDSSDSKIKTSELVVKETTSQIFSSSCLQPSGSDTTSEEPSAPNSSSDTSLSTGLPETSKEPTNHSLPASPRTAEKDGEAETPDRETEEEKAKRLLYCSLCKVAVNSASQLQAHNSGTKHKTMLEARSGDGAIKSFPRIGVKAKMVAPSEPPTGLQNKTFHCEICDVHVNSETQLKQHISSRRHKDRAAGKPAKPKFSPYTPTQRLQSLQAIRLTLRKNQDLSKPMASFLLHRQLSIAAASIPPLSTFPLQSATHSGPALLHGQPLPQTMFHPASGAICSPHTSILFSPF